MNQAFDEDSQVLRVNITRGPRRGRKQGTQIGNDCNKEAEFLGEISNQSNEPRLKSQYHSIYFYGHK